MRISRFGWVAAWACFTLPIGSLAVPTATSSNPIVKASPHRVAVRSASIILKVPDFPTARVKVLKLAGQYGADLRDAKTEVDFNGDKHGSMTLQVDAPKLDALLDDLRGVGKLYSESVQTTDQTSLYEKLERRAGLLHQNESELLDFLRRPRRMRGSDILFVQYRLYQTRTEASDAMQERVDMSRDAGRGRVMLSLFEPEPKRTLDWGNWHAHAAYKAKGAFLEFTRKILTGLYFVGWFAPFWIPGAIILFVVCRKVNRWIRAWWARQGSSLFRRPQRSEES
ncbi:MAG: DUF4349 domain-containing protein [Chloroflexi bacterium]|nr:DUF4349 domain-containing protein [Chloroflexota bacterium]MCL5105385.1 DUF4349 domain-containing protein [Armatimonadota bacterium]